MLVILMWMMLAVPIVVGLYLFNTNRISVRNDLFFIIMLTQVFLYLNLGPSMSFSVIDNEALQANYVLLQILCIVFFELPLVFLYLKYRARSILFAKSYSIAIKNNNINQIVLAIFVLLGSILFAYVMFTNDFFYTRIGSFEKAEKVVNLSGSVLWLVARWFEKASLFLFGVLLSTCFLVNKSIVTKAISFISVLVFLMIFGSYFLINSRLCFAVLLAMIFCVYVFRSKQFHKKSILFALIIVILLFYSFKVVSNIRNNSSSQSYNVFVLSNFAPWSFSADKIKESNFKRMDGIDLMAQVSQNLSYDNIPLGVAWKNPILMTFAPIIATDEMKDIKLRADTGAKNYLMKNFTNIQMPDYYSCMLTDVYGNFWIFGFILVAFFLAKACAYVGSNLIKPGSSSALIIAIYLMSTLLPFEQDFIGIFSNFAQQLPFLLLVVVINPVRVYRY